MSWGARGRRMGPTSGSQKRFLARAFGRRGRARGQGLVEFAIAFPVVFLMIMFGIDFGRVFLGWVQLSNAVREGANFASANPVAVQAANGTARAEYDRLMNAEVTGINCVIAAADTTTPAHNNPAPTFPNGTSLGSPAVVAITCKFSLITPIIANILGSPINVSASSVFPVRAGAIQGVPVGGTLPSFSTAT